MPANKSVTTTKQAKYILILITGCFWRRRWPWILFLTLIANFRKINIFRYEKSRPFSVKMYLYCIITHYLSVQNAYNLHTYSLMLKSFQNIITYSKPKIHRDNKNIYSRKENFHPTLRRLQKPQAATL